MPADRDADADADVKVSPFLLGAGRVGTALALGLVRAGLPPTGVWTRSLSTANRLRALTGLECEDGAFPEALAAARVVLIAVTDSATQTLVERLHRAQLLRSARVVLHCAGGRPSAEALAPLPGSIARGTFHPLLAVADPERAAARLRGAAFILEGDDLARQAGAWLATRLGGQPLELPARGLVLYHAAAVLASNHAVAIWAAALELLTFAGLARPDGLRALLPLLRSTVENLGALGLPAALTGPVRRGDADRVAAHLSALQQAAPAILPLYREASALALGLAERLGESDLDAIRRLLERPE